jgi:hypothetical protein
MRNANSMFEIVDPAYLGGLGGTPLGGIKKNLGG